MLQQAERPDHRKPVYRIMSHITALLRNGSRVEISTAEHSWHADEPMADGGTGAGPTPYEMLLGSLAACTTITLHMYTRHKGIPVAWIKAEYEFDRIYAEDCQECEGDETGLIERVQAHVTIGGTFDEAQRIRLAQLVSRCPVHKTLSHGMKILDHVAFAAVDGSAAEIPAGG
jgi:putative redox protein